MRTTLDLPEPLITEAMKLSHDKHFSQLSQHVPLLLH